MIRLLTCCLFACIIPGFVQAQPPLLDKSPMDMSYFPHNYPTLKAQDKLTTTPLARIIYSRPEKAGRQIFGELIEYNKIWRLGANEATEIEFFQPVTIGNTKVKKGRYTLYAIPATDKWTIILNKQTDIWGSFRYDEAKDILRTTIPVEKNDAAIELFTMHFEKASNGCSLFIYWDDVKVSLPILFN